MNHIHIIDDSPEDLRLLAQSLREKGYLLSFSYGGYDGYQRVAISPPDLILLDDCMPKVDGFAACRLLKSNKQTRRIPVIFMTATNDPEARLKGLALGAVDCISKPFSPDEVLARVRIHLTLAHHLRKEPASRQPDASSTALPFANPNVDEALVNATKNLLAENLHTPLTMDDLVRYLNTEERLLNKVFRQYTGMTVFVWMREERLRQARHLLAETSLDLTTVADQLGYHSLSHFSNDFYNRNGIRPRDYRANSDSELIRKEY